MKTKMSLLQAESLRKNKLKNEYATIFKKTIDIETGNQDFLRFLQVTGFSAWNYAKNWVKRS